MNTPESENKAVKHSTEPWSVKDSHNSFTPFALWGQFSFEPIGYIHCKSNAARIVACVNFCAGVSNEDLKQVTAHYLQLERDNAVNKLAEIRAQLQAVKEENRWISVSERVPETNGHYLVNVTDRGFSWQVSATYFPSLKFFNNQKGRLDGVTHWKTIEPPRGHTNTSEHPAEKRKE